MINQIINPTKELTVSIFGFEQKTNPSSILNQQAEDFLAVCDQYVYDNRELLESHFYGEMSIPYEYFDDSVFDLRDQAVLDEFGTIVSGFYKNTYREFTFIPSEDGENVEFNFSITPLDDDELDQTKQIVNTLSAITKKICKNYRQTTTAECSQFLDECFELFELCGKEFGTIEHGFGKFTMIYLDNNRSDFVQGFIARVFNREVEVNFYFAGGHVVVVRDGHNPEFTFFITNDHVYDDFNEFDLQVELQS